MLKNFIVVILFTLSIQTNILASSIDNSSTEVDKFAQNIASAIQNNNPSYINNLFCYNTFINNIVYQNNKFAEFNKNFSDKLLPHLDLGIILIEQLNRGAKYSFLNSTIRGNEIDLLYRVHSEYGIDYNKIILKKLNGDYKIVDVYMYFDGTLLSETISSIYVLSAQEMNPELFDVEDILLSTNTLKKENKLLKLLEKERYSKCLVYWDDLNPELKYNKKIMLLAQKAASYCDTDKMHEIYNEYNEKFTTNNDIELVVLEGLFVQQEYKQSLYVIDRLDSNLHTDPYLHYLRASVYKMLKEPIKSEWFLKCFIKELPREETGYFSLLELYLENEQFTNATLLLDDISNTFGFYKDDLKPLIAQYPEYSKSVEYAQWIEE